MIISTQTLELLGEIINEKSQYRSGPKLVNFFNELGFNDMYGQGFPSRKDYTSDRLSKINGSPMIDKCIRNTFDPRNFIGRYSDLDALICEFNSYLSYDGWNIYIDGCEISFKRKNKIDIAEELKKGQNMNEEVSLTESEFLSLNYEMHIDKLRLDTSLTDVLELRTNEIHSSLKHNIPLATIFLIGSTLEGILLAIATKNNQIFITAKSAPKQKNTNKVKPVHEWNLNNLIDTAKELGFIKEDVKKFSHVVRDFRNYIHPYEQMLNKFNPDIHTAQICYQVLKAAIFQICEFISKNEIRQY